MDAIHKEVLPDDVSPLLVGMRRIQWWVCGVSRWDPITGTGSSPLSNASLINACHVVSATLPGHRPKPKCT